MIQRAIQSALGRRLLAILLVAAGTGLGAAWLADLRRDVFPDLAAPVFNVIVQNPAMGPEELETGAAIPLEAALSGLPEVRRLRSNSTLGDEQVTNESVA